MNMRIENEKTGEEKPIQQFNINSTMDGHLECPTMDQEPSDKGYIIRPFDIRIKLTNKFEPKHPKFKVVEPQ